MSTRATVYLCPECGLLMGKFRLVDGLIPHHEYGAPLHGVCPGSGKLPNVFGSNGQPTPVSAKGAKS